MLLTPPRSWRKWDYGQGSLHAMRHSYARAHRRRLPAVHCSTEATSSTEALQEKLEGRIVVLGAGPAGLAAAAALQSVGLPAVVLEREEQLNSGGTALGLWTNAWRALEAMGVAESLRQKHPRVDSVELCRSDGRRLRSFSLGECEGGPHEFRGVRRASLLQALASRLGPDSLFFDCPILRVEATSQGAVLELPGSFRGPRRVECLAVVGADGARSAVAAALGRGKARYVGQSAIRGVAVYPEGVPCSVIRQVWGEGPRAGMYPISDTELYWFVCFDAAASPAPSTPVAWREEALQKVMGWGWSVGEVVRNTPLNNLTRSRIVDRWDLPSSKQRGAVTLAGDALHPMTPNLGQGGCTALEDAVVLARLLRDRGIPELMPGGSPPSPAARAEAVAALSAAFREYERQRAARCLPITVRSFAMGALLQLPLPPVVAARDVFVENLFSPSHFLDHATFDCGRL